MKRKSSKGRNKKRKNEEVSYSQRYNCLSEEFIFLLIDQNLDVHIAIVLEVVPTPTGCSQGNFLAGEGHNLEKFQIIK